MGVPLPALLQYDLHPSARRDRREVGSSRVESDEDRTLEEKLFHPRHDLTPVTRETYLHMKGEIHRLTSKCMGNLESLIVDSTFPRAREGVILWGVDTSKVACILHDVEDLLIVIYAEMMGSPRE